MEILAKMTTNIETPIDISIRSGTLSYRLIVDGKVYWIEKGEWEKLTRIKEE